MSQHVKITKELRVELDSSLQKLKTAACLSVTAGGYAATPAQHDPLTQRASRERSIAITKLQEAIMWLGMDLKGLKEDGLSDEPNPYPESYNPNSPVVEKTADGLKL